ncbi:hypothetical protein GJV85_07310 [Sulfurimonas aquatica]|uniref:Uncharacterized protein n=1 Tax=Sulfurimonas aquatica TaxID=2672570 RepID=A0A975B0K0_9BACT|nr:hypothetical protein [Sulfurimonas aquatica]QSZ41920.1 hypothetical protein GJV85_07310 [Sulfurimonas aquatica]
MIETYFLGLIAQLILAISILPYTISIFRGTVKPNRISWFIWSIIGFAFWLITPSTADEVTKMLTVIFMVNPSIIFILTIFKGENIKPDNLEKFSLIIGITAILIWYIFKDDSGLLPIIIAIIADFCALIPTLRFVFNSPHEERPLAWILFFLGSLIALFAIEAHTLESMMLPAYMTVGSFFVVFPLVLYRVKMKIPLKNWII